MSIMEKVNNFIIFIICCIVVSFSGTTIATAGYLPENKDINGNLPVASPIVPELFFLCERSDHPGFGGLLLFDQHFAYDKSKSFKEKNYYKYSNLQIEQSVTSYILHIKSQTYLRQSLTKLRRLNI